MLVDFLLEQRSIEIADYHGGEMKRRKSFRRFDLRLSQHCSSWRWTGRRRKTSFSGRDVLTNSKLRGLWQLKVHFASLSPSLPRHRNSKQLTSEPWRNVENENEYHKHQRKTSAGAWVASIISPPISRFICRRTYYTSFRFSFAIAR